MPRLIKKSVLKRAKTAARKSRGVLKSRARRSMRRSIRTNPDP